MRQHTLMALRSNGLNLTQLLLIKSANEGYSGNTCGWKHVFFLWPPVFIGRDILGRQTQPDPALLHHPPRGMEVENISLCTHFLV